MKTLDFPCSQQLARREQNPAVFNMPEDPRIRALCRPSNYGDLNPIQRREIDRELDLLEWSGVV